LNILKFDVKSIAILYLEGQPVKGNKILEVVAVCEKGARRYASKVKFHTVTATATNNQIYSHNRWLPPRVED